MQNAAEWGVLITEMPRILRAHEDARVQLVSRSQDAKTQLAILCSFASLFFAQPLIRITD